MELTVHNNADECSVRVFEGDKCLKEFYNSNCVDDNMNEALGFVKLVILTEHGIRKQRLRVRGEDY